MMGNGVPSNPLPEILRPPVIAAFLWGKKAVIMTDNCSKTGFCCNFRAGPSVDFRGDARKIF